MTFVSYSYFVFLIIALIIYYILPHRLRWAALLLASVTFAVTLGWDCALWLAVATLISYLAALSMSKAFSLGRSTLARMVLLISLVLMYGLLFVFKYLNFSLGLFGVTPNFSLMMPIGISFYIFQTTGYLLDVYRKKSVAVKHMGKYALAVSFFPKLTQGPIEPVSHFLPQLDEKRVIDPLAMRYGAVTILLGLFKKVVIADRLAVAVNTVFGAVASGGEATGFSVAIGAVFYAFQLYADFSGYTDIALGSARLLGLSLSPNFRQPYLARSIGDFWRRWHITLSNWLRDNIYIPLGGNRVSRLHWCFNVMVVFLVSGVWHGAGWTFIVWGALHGLYQIVGKQTSALRGKIRDRLPRYLKPVSVAFSVLFTFILVDLAWIFFRSASVNDALRGISLLFNGGWTPNIELLGINIQEWWMCIGLIFTWLGIEIAKEHTDITQRLEALPLPLRWIVYLTLLMVIILFGFYGNLSADSFIYVGF